MNVLKSMFVFFCKSKASRKYVFFLNPIKTKYILEVIIDWVLIDLKKIVHFEDLKNKRISNTNILAIIGV